MTLKLTLEDWYDLIPDHATNDACVRFSFHRLVMTSFLGQNLRSRSANLYLHYPLFRQTIPSNNTSFYSIVTFHLPFIARIGTFLIYSPIVLPFRKAPIGLVYKPAHMFSCSLASSVHYLLSNLVFPLSSSLDLSLACFLSLCHLERRTSLRLVAQLRPHQPLVFMSLSSELIGLLHVIALHLSGHC